MALRVVVAPVETVADTPDGLLEYLARRTATTISTFVDRADTVIVGTVAQTDASSVPVRREFDPVYPGHGLFPGSSMEQKAAVPAG